MANADTPFGLIPYRHLNGMPWNGQVHKCYVPSTDSTSAYFVGDVVDIAGSADTDGTCLTVIAGSAGLATYPIFGVIVAFEPDAGDLSLQYRKDDTARYCYVCCDPDVIFLVQGCSSAVIAATAVGLNACLVKTHSGSTITGKSGWELDSGATNAPAANATYPLMILGAAPLPDNDISAVNAKWQVLIAMHRLRPNYSNSAYFGALGIS